MDTPQNTVLDTLALIMELQMERDNGESQQSEFVFEINNQIVRALDDQANSSPDTKEELPDATEQDHQQQVLQMAKQ